MFHGVMITHGPGGHSPWRHAEVTAEKIVIDPPPSVDDYAAKCNAAGELRHKLREELVRYHDNIAKDWSPEHLDAHINAAADAVLALSRGTVLESHFLRPEIQTAVRDVLAMEFRSQQYIHHGWNEAR